MTQSPIVVGLAAYGMRGKVFHAPFLEQNPHYNLKYIVERNKEDSKSDYSKATILQSFDELLQQKDLELVIINTPTYLHYEMSKSALEAGKHIVVEKPFAVTSKQCEELISISEKSRFMLSKLTR